MSQVWLARDEALGATSLSSRSRYQAEFEFLSVQRQRLCELACREARGGVGDDPSAAKIYELSSPGGRTWLWHVPS